MSRRWQFRINPLSNFLLMLVLRVLFAKSYLAQRAMGICFEHRQIHKTYHALVKGLPAQITGQIDFPLICDWPNRPKQKVCYQQGKPAQTEFRVIDHNPQTQTSLLHLHPITGRSHQLRVHCWHIGHPILGDQLYNTDGTHTLAKRLMLHAAALEFIHPIENHSLTIKIASGFNVN